MAESAPQKAPKYIALYAQPLLKLIDVRDHQAKTVLEVLATCADAFGWCFPGDAWLGETIGIRREKAADALTRLQMMGYIHIVYTQNVRRRNTSDRDIQISPYVLAIRDECRERALEQWNSFANGVVSQNSNSALSPSETDHHARTQVLINFPSVDHDHDQSSLSRSGSNGSNTRIQQNDPTSESNSMIHHHHQTTFPEGDPGDSFGEADENSAESARSASASLPAPAHEDTEPEAQTQRRMAQSPSTPPSPPSPRRALPEKLPELKIYPAALPDEHDETLALHMSDGTGRGMSMAVARGLIMQYGAVVCTTALHLLAEKRGVVNAAGHLRWMIQKGQLDPEADNRPIPNPWAGYDQTVVPPWANQEEV